MAIRIYQAILPQDRQILQEMMAIERFGATFQPILFEKSEDCRLSQFDLPEHAEKRGQSLLLVTFHAEDARRLVGLVPVACLRSGAQSEVEDLAAAGTGTLQMSDFVDHDARFAIDAHGLSIPGVGLARWLGDSAHAEPVAEVDGLAVVEWIDRQCEVLSGDLVERGCDTLKNRPRPRLVGESVGETG